jgi:hypothetical protein
VEVHGRAPGPVDPVGREALAVDQELRLREIGLREIGLREIGQPRVEIEPVVRPVQPRAIGDRVAGGAVDGELGGGSSLTVPANATRLPPLTAKAELALAAVDPAQVHPRLLASGPGSTPRAAFALVPLGASFSPPTSYRLSLAGATPGTMFELFVADPETGKLGRHGPAKIVDGAAGPVLEGELRTLSWLLFYAP